MWKATLALIVFLGKKRQNEGAGACPASHLSKVWKLFCYTMAISLSIYYSLTRLHLNKKYEAVKCGLEKIHYDLYEWFICVDLKKVSFLVGQHSGFTKYPGLLCMWDSRYSAPHFFKKDWPVWKELISCIATNIINKILVDTFPSAAHQARLS